MSQWPSSDSAAAQQGGKQVAFAAHEFMELVVSASGLVAWEWNVATDFVARSANSVSVLGISSGPIAEFIERVHSEDRDSAARRRELLLSGERLAAVEFRFIKPDGSTIWVEERAQLVSSSTTAGRVIGLTADITARKEAQLALEASEARYRAITRASASIVWRASPEGKLVQVWAWDNSVHEALLKSAVGGAWPQFFHPDDVGPMTDLWLWHVERGEPYDVDARFRLPDAIEYNWATLRGVPVRAADGTILEWIGTLIDTTEKKQAEEALRSSERRFRAMADSAPVMVWVTEPDGYCSYLSKSWSEFSGQSQEQSTGFGWLEVLHPEDRARARKVFEDACRSEAAYHSEYRARRVDGAYRWVIAAAAPRFAESGKFAGYVGSVLDITERKEAELALEASERRFRLLAENASDIISQVGLDGLRSYVSPSCQEVMGYAPEQLIGKRWSSLVHPDDLPVAEKQFQELASGMLAQCTSIVRIRHGSGTWIYLEKHMRLARDSDHAPSKIIIVAHDITHRLQLEEQLQQAHRLDAVGQLTGGVAHDFNNLLTVVIGNLEYLREELHGRSDLDSAAELALGAAERGAELVSGLLSFARKQTLAPKRVDVHNLVVGMHKLLRRTLNEDIALRFITSEQLFQPFVDSAQLESAILNLCLNARDAMPSGGVITVTTTNKYLEAGTLHGEEVVPGRYVAISVADTGVGISPENLERIFEPFFTTKQASKGSGLGLSMVYGFVRQSKGYVKVTSEKGKETVVTLFLPDGGPTLDQVQDKSELCPPLQSMRAKILVVEDDENVLSHAQRLLQDLGYEVVSASDAISALGILSQAPDLDLLFTDVIMPGGMNGAALAEKARQVRPDLPILFTSGYTEDSLLADGKMHARVRMLPKPYRRLDLQKAVHDALGDRACPPSHSARAGVEQGLS